MRKLLKKEIHKEIRKDYKKINEKIEDMMILEILGNFWCLNYQN